MILYKTELTRDTVAKYFPETLSNESDTHYGIEITAMRKTNSKLISHAHIGVFKWCEQVFDGRTIVMRELFPMSKCIRVYLRINDNSPLKPMRASSKHLIPAFRQSIASESVRLVRERILPVEHPYIQAMHAFIFGENEKTHNEKILSAMQQSGHLQIIKC